MAAPASAYRDRQFLAVIGDEDSVTGLLLAGVGHITQPPDSQKNFLVVDEKTENSTIEEAFESFTQNRKDIAILLINQHIAERIRNRVDNYTAAFPALLEIPSKDHPYDPEKDSVLRRVRRLFGDSRAMPANNSLHITLIWAPCIIILLPLNVWAAWSFSLDMLLNGYMVLFSSMMNCLAIAILVAGIVLPPASLAYWVWEKYQEPTLQ